MQTELKPKLLLETADNMAIRVRERFPGSGLSKVAEDLAQTARKTAEVAESISHAKPGFRFLGVLVTLAIASMAGLAIYDLKKLPLEVKGLAELVQGTEALINILVFGGVAIYFVFSLETRVKRAAALKMLARLRSLAHVIDMHQLSKDPDRLRNILPPTEHSPPKMQLTPELLVRYLDYCGDLLAILSKFSALLVQKFDDPVTLDSVNDLEELVSGLSRKIWQKIMIVDRIK